MASALSLHPISAFDAGWQPEILSPIARLPSRVVLWKLLDSILQNKVSVFNFIIYNVEKTILTQN
jgi:hypothetical protein